LSPALEAKGLRAGYDKSVIVRDLDLRVEPGEIVALLGANGAGKSSLLKAVLGLEQPAEALAEQAVVVDQQYPNFAAHNYHSCFLVQRLTTPPRSWSPRFPVRNAGRL